MLPVEHPIWSTAAQVAQLPYLIELFAKRDFDFMAEDMTQDGARVVKSRVEIAD